MSTQHPINTTAEYLPQTTVTHLLANSK